MTLPSLQRLLSKPGLVDNLRSLNRSSLRNVLSTSIRRKKMRLYRNLSRAHGDYKFCHSSARPNVNEVTFTEGRNAAMPVFSKDLLDPGAISLGRLDLPYGIWELRIWNHHRLEFESDLDDGQPGKLLDCVHTGEYMKIWGYLLNYRYRTYGLAGVRMYWKATIKNNLQLPVTGVLAKLIWSTFLQLGFQSDEVLEQISDYANKLLRLRGKKWLPLYDHILEHFLVNWDGIKALEWHERLFPLHPPGAKRFRSFFREVLHREGDITTLKNIYKLSPYRNVYSSVVPLYCKRGQFQKAADWHFFLLEHEDRPPKAEIVEPLIKHLLVYDKARSILVTQSLINTGVLNSDLVDKFENPLKISAEMMNLIHGKTFAIKEKKYNDELGARWFATTCVSVDTAISTVQALGVREIGPLSLQAIALRDPTPESILHRISQLHELGIFVGTSMFAKAVKRFARLQKLEFLQGLLHSDQHPDQLDNQRLQDKLLYAYAQAHNWPQFERTLEIRSIACKNPSIAKKNLLLKVLFNNPDISAAQDALDEMLKKRIPIKPDTISHICARILRPRRRAQSPSNDFYDVELSIKILHSIMCSGSFVPPYFWREIIRRLGMRGRLDHLENLCLVLAKWYVQRGGKNKTCRAIPPGLQTNHRLHPARILFNSTFQRAVVAWGFIHALGLTYRHVVGNQKLVPTDKASPDLPDLPDVTFGIRLLKKLRQLGVYTDGCVISQAILNRFLTYYGPGKSGELYNRVGQFKLQGRMKELARQIDEALGSTYFLGLDFPAYLQVFGEMKLRRLDRLKERMAIKAQAR